MHLVRTTALPNLTVQRTARSCCSRLGR